MAIVAQPQVGAAPDPALLGALVQKYEEEKQKRIRADGSKQYVDLESTSQSHLKRMIEDPWVDHAALNSAPPALKDGDDVKFLIVGAGFCGLVFAVRLIEAGFSVDDIRIIDVAGDVGGTWYWNRYPGVQCDTEAAMYLPLLEETGYMPRQRYSSGDEIRRHALRITEKWGLRERAQFRTSASSFVWDEDKSRWIVKLRTERGPGEKAVDSTVSAQFVILGTGILSNPKVPKLEGIEDFRGETLHSARWRYELTGGAPDRPLCDKLQGKRVGLIGTGATGIQCATALAKTAGELLVFQRTPSTVDERGQRDTDPKEWAEKVANKPGWWTARNTNFAAHLGADASVTEDLVNDGWTGIQTYWIVTGGPEGERPPPSLEEMPGHVQKLLTIDAPRAERLRKRVDQLVKDKETAEALKAWYPSWCKRPTFHDEFLPIFNQPNVKLVPTEAHGLSKATSKGLVVNGQEYELDVIIFGTGFRTPSSDLMEPSHNSNATFTGRGGLDLRDKWLGGETGPKSLHGLFTKGFPNLIITGPPMSAASINYTYIFDIKGRHVAGILSEAARRAGDAADRVAIEPTAEAEDAWASEILARAAWGAPMANCTPSLANNEGSLSTGAKAAGAAPYPGGINGYARILKEWRARGGLEGLEVRY